MSTNSECSFIEPKPGEWFYILEHYHAPKNSWDWREHATAYGPFTSNDEAEQHLSENHANPGGWSVTDNAHFRMDPIYESLIRDARANARRSRW